MNLARKVPALVISLFISATLLGAMASCQNKGMMTSSEAFPNSATLSSLLSNYTISGISITNGNTGEVKKTSDPAKINEFLDKLEDVKFKRKDSVSNGTYAGYTYSIDFYFKNTKGYYEYTMNHGFTKSEDFTGMPPTGECTVENVDTVNKIIKNFCNGLK